MNTPEPTYVAPPSLRQLFPFTKAPVKVPPDQVLPMLEGVLTALARRWPYQFTIVKDGPFNATVTIDVDIPALPPPDHA